ncbi:MAG: lysophospholipid acyltransferase family protein [Planctomycetota bacterium]|jgi:KDO2-lipid IV(A) lauroyltransferase
MAVGQKIKRTKKSKHHPAVDYLAYVLMRIALFIIFLSPIHRNLRFARFLGRLMWKHYHRGRDRAMTNLRAAYPEKDEAWLEATGKRSFENLVMLVMDVMFTPKLVRKDNWTDYADFINIERAKWMMKENKGMLLLSGHYGNFEIMGYMLGLFGFEVYSIARPLDNPYINDYLYGIRQRKGQKIINKHGATEDMTRLAEQGATLCFISDQDAGRKGVFVDFFGRKASSYKSILPIGVGVCRRVGDAFKFEVEVGRIIEPCEWADKEKPLDWVTAEYNAELENLIRKDPTQYWWLHRRWKTRPKEERKTAKK